MITTQELFDITLKESNVVLTEAQHNKLLIACERSILENTDDNTRKSAAKIYLKMILEFPTMSL